MKHSFASILWMMLVFIIGTSAVSAQDLPSWAEPNERQTYERHQPRNVEPLRLQSDAPSRTPDWSKPMEYDDYRNGNTPDVNCDQVCETPAFERSNGASSECGCDSEQVPIENPYGFAFLIIAGASYAIFKLH